MSKAIPDEFKGIIPHLVCSPCTEAIEFYKKAFGAVDEGAMPTPDGGRIMHACIRIDGAPLFLVDDMPEYCGGKSMTATSLGGTPVTIHRYVEDVDAAIKRAEEAGATVTMPAEDMFWGDRYGQVRDPYGHMWSIATHKRDMTPEEMKKEMDAAFAQFQPGK
ncbi:MAG: VOC family protein [Candidatus Hydrogenedentes bacterium]|nr:VOC family protein [Candidatus Hydrogenedentota bacterium]